jgi:hypothetical protein
MDGWIGGCLDGQVNKYIDKLVDSCVGEELAIEVDICVFV